MPPVLERLTNQDESQVDMAFHCPGCKCLHSFRVRGTNPWVWDGNMEHPTFSPSLLVNNSRPERRCHLFVRNGKIEFLHDCWHDLKGKTVDMEPVG